MLREYNVQAKGPSAGAYRETIRKKAIAKGSTSSRPEARAAVRSLQDRAASIPSSSHENMKEMSTDDLDLLAKEVVGGGSAGKWKFDKEQPLSLIDKIVGGSIPRIYRPIEAGIREALDTAFWRFPDGGRRPRF